MPSPPVRPIRDHRGVLHDQDQFDDAEGAPFEVVEAIDDAWEIGYREPMNRRQACSLLASLVILFGGVALVVWIERSVQLGWLATAGLLLCLLVAFGFVLATTPLGRAMDRAEPQQEIIDNIVAAGYCPCCATHLASLPRCADGCVECPHCSAAWRIQDLGDPSAPPR